MAGDGRPSLIAHAVCRLEGPRALEVQRSQDFSLVSYLTRWAIEDRLISEEISRNNNGKTYNLCKAALIISSKVHYMKV